MGWKCWCMSEEIHCGMGGLWKGEGIFSTFALMMGMGEIGLACKFPGTYKQKSIKKSRMGKVIVHLVGQMKAQSATDGRNDPKMAHATSH